MRNKRDGVPTWNFPLRSLIAFYPNDRSREEQPGWCTHQDTFCAMNPLTVESFRCIDALLVRQEVELFEAFTKIETSNSYIVLGASQGEAKCRYLVVEDSPYYGLAKLLGNRRPFTLRVVEIGLNDTTATARSGIGGCDINPHLLQKEAVLLIERPFAFIQQNVLIKDGRGSLMGTVTKEVCQCWNRDFIVRDANNVPVLKLHQGFEIMSLLGVPRWKWSLIDMHTGLVVGDLRKQWSGLMQELMTDADNFGVQFRSSNVMPTTHKFLILASIFLIDFLYFEDNDQNSKSKRKGGLGMFLN